MAICAIFGIPGQTEDGTDELMAALRATGPLPPTGALQVFGGPHDGAWRMIGVWGDEESMERFFTTRLPQAFEDTGRDPAGATRAVFTVRKQLPPWQVPAPA